MYIVHLPLFNSKVNKIVEIKMQSHISSCDPNGQDIFRSASSARTLCERHTVTSGGLYSCSKVHQKLPGDEKSYLHFWANSPFDGGTAECVVCP